MYLYCGGKVLKKLDPKKLHVNFGMGVEETKPIIIRRYTLTHSDTTGELFLDVAGDYAYDKFSEMRDEVLAEWVKTKDGYALMVNIMVDKDWNVATSSVRNSIFAKELPLALQAIRYGDREFFKENSFLDKAPIYVVFNSVYPMFNRLELWGTPLVYKRWFLI